MNKREDIQWLRALAVFAVLGFHIWPNIFLFGYLGVDIFFVVSGYLITSILSKSLSKQTLLQFYQNRVKRIFPTYFFTITVFMIIGFMFLIPAHFESLKKEALWSIFFVNNLSSMFNQKQYFEMVSEFKFFLHTWSLGVEIQYYLIAPFLIKFILIQTMPLSFIAVLMSFSFFSQLLIPNTAVTFGSIFCRIWQFLAGTVAFSILQKKESELQKIPENKYIQFLLKSSFIKTLLFNFIILICFFPLNLFSEDRFMPQILRLIATILTASFIVINNEQELIFPSLLNQFLIYMGNASYVIYLVHWPIIVFFKYFSLLDDYGELITLLIIFGISLFIYNYFEKPMLKQSLKINFLFVAFCYGIILYMCLFQKTIKFNPPNTVTNNIKEAESCLKFYLADTCKEDILIEKYYKKRPFGSIADIGCSYESDPSSNKTLLITGNSFVYYQIQGISEAIKKSKTKFSKIYVIGYTVCNLLAGSLNKFLAEFQCEMIEGSFDDFVAKVKINVIIYTAKIDHMPGFQYYLTRNVSALSEDDGYNAALTSIMKRKSVADKFIIIQPSPALSGVRYQNPLSVARLLFSNRNLSTFDLPIQLYRKKIYPGWDRIKEAAKQCSNCILVETEKIFCNENFCPVIDAETLLARYCDEGHITPTESLKLVSELVSAIDKNIL